MYNGNRIFYEGRTFGILGKDANNWLLKNGDSIRLSFYQYKFREKEFVTEPYEDYTGEIVLNA